MTDGLDMSLMCRNSNESTDINRTHYYNSFLNKKYNSLDLMTEHRRPHGCSTWGPYMHARRLHHRLWSLYSTSTISFDHRTPEHRHPHARTASPITIVIAAWTRALPLQHASAATRTRTRGLVSV
jgi:hypothetical protein